MKCEDDVLRSQVIRKALSLLERMDRTEKGLRDRLLQYGYPEELVEDAVKYVKSYGYVNDARYAENYIRYRIDTKSRRQLMEALYRKGIGRQVFEDAWEEIARELEPDEDRLIRSLIRKKTGGRCELDDREYHRLQSFLARRGFSWDAIASAMEREQIRRLQPLE